jgi:hypothetical protein
MISWVYAIEHGWIVLDLTEFLNIEEGFDGRDQVTFEYEGQEYCSNVIQSWGRPG